MSKKISLPIAVVIMIALVLTTFMATYTLTSVHYRMRMTEAYLEGIEAASGNEQFSKLAKVMELFHTNSI